MLLCFVELYAHNVNVCCQDDASPPFKLRRFYENVLSKIKKTWLKVSFLSLNGATFVLLCSLNLKQHVVNNSSSSA